LSIKTYKHNNTDYFEYVPPASNVLATNIAEFRFLLEKFCKKLNLNTGDFHVDEKLFIKACLKTDRQKLRYKVFHGIQLSELKVVGMLAYWVIRFKPLVYGVNKGSVENPKYHYTTRNYNELFALYLMFAVLERYCAIEEKESFQPTKKQIKNLHYVLLHRPLSEDLMSTLLEPIGEMLRKLPKGA